MRQMLFGILLVPSNGLFESTDIYVNWLTCSFVGHSSRYQLPVVDTLPTWSFLIFWRKMGTQLMTRVRETVLAVSGKIQQTLYPTRLIQEPITIPSIWVSIPVWLHLYLRVLANLAAWINCLQDGESNFRSHEGGPNGPSAHRQINLRAISFSKISSWNSATFHEPSQTFKHFLALHECMLHTSQAVVFSRWNNLFSNLHAGLLKCTPDTLVVLRETTSSHLAHDCPAVTRIISASLVN